MAVVRITNNFIWDMTDSLFVRGLCRFCEGNLKQNAPQNHCIHWPKVDHSCILYHKFCHSKCVCCDMISQQSLNKEEKFSTCFRIPVTFLNYSVRNLNWSFCLHLPQLEILEQFLLFRDSLWAVFISFLFNKSRAKGLNIQYRWQWYRIHLSWFLYLLEDNFIPTRYIFIPLLCK